ncbi:hypothetical protein K502DRAFT_367282 [Neoconidiobolus thromboides FSU 785]|nr:hypothetical protein K502DRAFT_367282 [Neoconidiobolus thromboides FSU 785]
MVNTLIRHYLKGGYDASRQITPFYTPESIETIIASLNNYDTLKNIAKYLRHNNIHTDTGSHFDDLVELFLPKIYCFMCIILLLISYDYSKDDELDRLNVTVTSTFNTKVDGCRYEYRRHGADTKGIETTLRFVLVLSSQLFSLRVVLEQISTYTKSTFNGLITVFKSRSNQEKIIPFVEPMLKNIYYEKYEHYSFKRT